jgi:hypothetical protein
VIRVPVKNAAAPIRTASTAAATASVSKAVIVLRVRVAACSHTGGNSEGVMMDETFMDIAQTTVSKAAAVDCSPEAYRDGLKIIIAELEIALEAVQNDIKEYSHE